MRFFSPDVSMRLILWVQQREWFLTAANPFIRSKFYVVNVVLHVNGAVNLLDDNDDDGGSDEVAVAVAAAAAASVAITADNEAKFILYLASFIIMSDYIHTTLAHDKNFW